MSPKLGVLPTAWSIILIEEPRNRWNNCKCHELL